MKRRKPEVTEVECPACEGTGFPVVEQPVQPGRKIFPAPCQHCAKEGCRVIPDHHHRSKDLSTASRYRL